MNTFPCLETSAQPDESHPVSEFFAKDRLIQLRQFGTLTSARLTENRTDFCEEALQGACRGSREGHRQKEPSLNRLDLSYSPSLAPGPLYPHTPMLGGPSPHQSQSPPLKAGGYSPWQWRTQAPLNWGQFERDLVVAGLTTSADQGRLSFTAFLNSSQTFQILKEHGAVPLSFSIVGDDSTSLRVRLDGREWGFEIEGDGDIGLGIRDEDENTYFDFEISDLEDFIRDQIG